MTALKQLWVYIEQTAGLPHEDSLRLLAKAQAISAGRDYCLGVLLAGAETAALAAKLADWGLDVYAAEHELLQPLNHRAVAAVLAPFIRQQAPDILLFPGGKQAALLAAVLGTRLQTGVTTHCTDIFLNEQDLLVGLVPAYGGAMLGEILCPKARPQIAVTRAEDGCFKPLAQSGRWRKIPIPHLEPETKLQLLEQYSQPQSGPKLEEAEIVVCGGLGVGSETTWQQLGLLAQELGGAVACTRPPIDQGWGAEESMMIGTSGKSVSPRVYIGFGVSGAAHHVCGMQNSGLVLNINHDEKSPVFLVSDYGYVGDAALVIQHMLSLLRQNKS